jgi:hypothetical protein
MEGLSQKKWRLAAVFREKQQKSARKGLRWPPF